MSDVKIYSSEDCAPCQSAKKDLKDEGIDFKEVDIRSDKGHEEAQEKGVRNIPTVEVNGDRVTGYNNQFVDRIKKKMED